MNTRAAAPLALCLAMLLVPFALAGDCGDEKEATFTVQLPVCPEYVNPPVLEPDSLVVPLGRPIYALLVHGYSQNRDFDQLMCYKFAKRLMRDGAYVHYAWWNNLCAEYMSRPLHHPSSDPGSYDLLAFSDPDLGDKALPPDDFQFQADAESLLVNIRRHNPSATIILAGHSMGGAAVARLASNIDVVIDIVAPLDPVDNRSRPEGLIPQLDDLIIGGFDPVPPTVYPQYNYTRWRIARADFLGFKQIQCVDWDNGVCVECDGVGDTWYGYYDIPWPHSIDGVCGYTGYLTPTHYPYFYDGPQRTFGTNVINLYHRYQMEYLFPFDFFGEEHFGHNRPPDGTTSQQPAETCSDGADPGGYQNRCWDMDGHGEVIGFRGNPPLFSIESYPLGLQARNWPSGRSADDVCLRRRLLMQMAYADQYDDWEHRPYNPELCLVSDELITLYLTMNRPPVADAGGDRTVDHTGTGVVLDGSASYDPDDDPLTFAWDGPSWHVEGEVVTVPLGVGIHEITMTVEDENGHIDKDTVRVTVLDTDVMPTTRLVGAHPNPFNISVQVAFESTGQEPVALQIIDLQGRLVRTLEEGVFPPGRHLTSWDGIDGTGRIMSSGTYFVRMRAGEQTVLTKLLLLK